MKNGNRKDRLQNIALLYMIIWGISPPFSVDTIYRVIYVVCFVLWEIKAINNRDKDFLYRQLRLIVLIVVIVSISYLADGWEVGIIGNMQLMLFFSYYAVFLYYKDSDEDLNWIIRATLLLVILWNLCTLREYVTTRNVSRLLAKNFEGGAVYLKRGVGGYGYIYSIMIIIPALLGILIYKFKYILLKDRIIYLVALITSILVVFKSGYAIAVILTTISIILSAMFKEMKYPAITIFILLIGVVVLYVNLEKILYPLLPYVKGTMYESKVIDIIASLSDDQATGTVEGRTERYIRSIRLFIDSPMWGQLSRAHIGKHSAILDRFAQFGIFIGAAFVSYLMKVQMQIFKLRYVDGVAIAVLIATLGFSFLNNITLSQGVILFVLYPLIIYQISHNEQCALKHEILKE